MFKTDVYQVTIRLNNEMLGTNPQGLDVMDKHIIDKQRKLIGEKSKINKDINKYLEATDISEEDKEAELKALQNRLEQVTGQKLNEDELHAVKEGKYKDVKSLLETFDELKEKGITCFFRNDEGMPTIGSHMIHGFMKAAGEVICRLNGKKNGVFLRSGAYTTSSLNQRVSVHPKFIESSEDVCRNEDGKIAYNQRSLRAMTAQGPRISLAKSEVLPEGTVFKFEIHVMNSTENIIEQEQIETILSYGKTKGLGQWRNAGYGTFDVIEIGKV